MKGVKLMLLGIAIMLAVAVFHIALADTVLLTDHLAVVGAVLVVVGFCIGNNKNGNP